MRNEDYYYYLHKTKISDPEMIESLCNEGLKSRYHYSINSTLARVNEDELKKEGLEKCIMNYLGASEDYNSVVVVKIPKRYFRDRIHRDGKADPSIPLFREYSELGCDWNSIFTPKLIQGIYCRDIDKSFSNPNFCPVFDPSGCQFADEQISCFESFNGEEWEAWENFAKKRKNVSFQNLYMSDRTHSTWDSLVEHYSKLYGIIPKQMINYEMSEDEKQLFNSTRKKI